MRTVFSFIFFICVVNVQAQTGIKLIDPNKTRGMSVMAALNERQSIREYSSEELEMQDLSDLLWAANGINRPNGMRTAPSTRNLQAVEIYVAFSNGIFHYDHNEHALKWVITGDFRDAVAASQEYVKTAPLCILLVANMNKFGNLDENSKMFAAIDVGIVSQNISIACSAFGLATVPRGIMDNEKLKTALKLSDMHLLLLNHPVGYPK